MGALCDLVNRMRPAGRRLCVLSAPGDRRDEDIHAIAQVAASAGFDHYICRRDDPLRGRGEDEVPRMLADRLLAHGIGPDSITTIIDEQQAIEAALRMARPGDLLLIFADALARGWKQIVNFRPDDDALVLPAPRAARAVPRAAITESAPADDATPPRDTGMPVSRWRTMGDDFVLMHDGRGVILKAEASD